MIDPKGLLFGFRGKPTFQKEKNRYLKEIDSDKHFRGQFSVRNFRSYFINYSARENFIKNTIVYPGFDLRIDELMNSKIAELMS